MEKLFTAIPSTF